MGCLNQKWTRNCLTLSTLLLVAPSQCKHMGEVVDSYCDTYVKMVEDEEDARAATKLPLKMKRKLLVNEKSYLACPAKG